MRILLKILAPSFVLLLSLVLAVLTLFSSLTTGVLSIIALVAAGGLFFCCIGGDPVSGIRVLILMLGDLKYALWAI